MSYKEYSKELTSVLTKVNSSSSENKCNSILEGLAYLTEMIKTARKKALSEGECNAKLSLAIHYMALLAEFGTHYIKQTQNNNININDKILNEALDKTAEMTHNIIVEDKKMIEDKFKKNILPFFSLFINKKRDYVLPKLSSITEDLVVYNKRIANVNEQENQNSWKALVNVLNGATDDFNIQYNIQQQDDVFIDMN